LKDEGKEGKNEKSRERKTQRKRDKGRKQFGKQTLKDGDTK